MSDKKLDPLQEAEWLIQEAAARQESGGDHPASAVPSIQRYRAVTRVLRTPPPYSLPANFAHRVAHLAELAAARRTTMRDNVEYAIQCAFTAILVVVGGDYTLAYVRDWLSSDVSTKALATLLDPWSVTLAAAAVAIVCIPHIRITPRLPRD